MSSVCVSSCVKDARVPVRATYTNLYKWPESDAEFVKSVGSRTRVGRAAGQGQQPRVVDSISCRQIYLRSYTFSRKETVPERTRKCLDRVRDRVAIRRKMMGREGGGDVGGGHRKRRRGMSRVKEMSCAALFAIFRRLLSCAATVDVVEDHVRQRQQ